MQCPTNLCADEKYQLNHATDDESEDPESDESSDELERECQNLRAELCLLRSLIKCESKSTTTPATLPQTPLDSTLKSNSEVIPSTIPKSQSAAANPTVLRLGLHSTGSIEFMGQAFELQRIRPVVLSLLTPPKSSSSQPAILPTPLESPLTLLPKCLTPRTLYQTPSKVNLPFPPTCPLERCLELTSLNSDEKSTKASSVVIPPLNGTGISWPVL